MALANHTNYYESSAMVSYPETHSTRVTCRRMRGAKKNL
jgi:hypothetical protein